MIGDHHSRTAGEATLLVRAVDEIFGTHSCWRTIATLQRHCRIRSYLTTARSHGRHPLAAIRDALTGSAWMPPHPA
jgi:hypothetical protein